MASLWELFVKISGDNTDFKKSMQESEGVTQKFGSTFDALDKKLGAALGFGAIGAAALGAAKKFEDANVQIQRSTGATGEKLEALNKSFAAVYAQTGKSSETVTNALTLLSTRTNATGADLEKLTLATLRLSNVHKEDAATIIPAVTQAFSAWGVATSKQADAINYFRVVSQQTATPIATLTSELVSQAPMLRKIGLDWQQSATLIGNFDKGGNLAQGALVALKTVLKTFAKEGVTDTAAEWKKLVQGVQDGTVSFGEFIKVAGSRGGTALFDAIRLHRTDVVSLTKEYQDLAAKGVDSVKTIGERWTILQHQVEAFIGKHYELIAAIGLGYPVILSLGAGLAAAFGPAIPIAASLVAAIQGGLIGALTAAEVAVGAFAIGVGGGIAAGILDGMLAYLSKDVMTSKLAAFAFGIRGAMRNIFPGFGLYDIPSPAPAKNAAPNAADYVSGLHPPAGFDPNGDAKAAAEALKKAFSTLGLKDLTKELADSEAALKKLAAAGLLTNDQILKASGAIHKLRDELAGVRQLDLVPISPGGREVTTDQLNNLPVGDVFHLPELSAVSRVLEMITGAVNEQANAIAVETRNVGYVTDAFHYFGEQTPAELEETARVAKEQYDLMRESGTAAPDAIGKAWAVMFKAQLDAQLATGKITRTEYDDLVKQTDAAFGKMGAAGRKMARSISDELSHALSGALDTFDSNMARAIVTWKGGFDAIKNLGRDLASSLLKSFLDGLLKPLKDELTKLGAQIGGVFDKIWGSAGGSGGSVPGNVGGGGSAGGIGGSGGGAAASGVMGTIGAVGAAVGAVSSVIGNFQMAGMNKSLDVLVNHTLRIFNELSNFRVDAWTREQHWYARTSDMWQTMLDIKDTLGRGITTSGKGGVTFNNCSFNGTTPTAMMQAAFNAAYDAGVL